MGGVIFVRRNARLTFGLVNHESIHCRQQRELLYLPFFVIYTVEWLVRFALCFNSMRAYYNISFEREAYANGKNSEYLMHRKPYAWLSYLCRRHNR